MEQAQRVAWRMGVTEGHNPEALELYHRLDAARDEIASLRRGVWVGEPTELDPSWAELLATSGLLLPSQA